MGFVNGRLGRVLLYSSARRPRQGWSLYRQLGAGIEGLSERAGAVLSTWHSNNLRLENVLRLSAEFSYAIQSSHLAQ